MTTMQKSSKGQKIAAGVLVTLAALFIWFGSSVKPDGSTAGPAGPNPDISKATFQGDWPFTLKSGKVRCDEGRYLVFESGGTTYALNGVAASREFQIMGKGKMYEPLEKIWRPDPNPDFAKAGLKVNVGDVIQHAQKFCP
ncbi:DUF2511 domain-containing protein [Nitrospina watsonii]|uniref:DUF2511 domain-containing protein n=1 Tax=Nitrospina watsonii TaxID=1323948 RepID=A0ABM9HFY9_9BACT|nr:DUF2511 domain-containing protein [Nitrospina watsonii]CAI2719135.1 protein of unknown function [Nitrospina watsonii]